MGAEICSNYLENSDKKTPTLYNAILRIARNLLETRENIKIESHSFYHIICDRFSWGSSKKKIKNKQKKMADFQNRQFSKKFRVKTQNMHFLPVFALMSDSLTTI